jgi:hypothetical protein
MLGNAHYLYKPESASAAPLAGEKTLVIYDAASGTLPTPPLMNFIDFPLGAAQPVYRNGVTVLDTTLSGQETYAGWTASGTSTPGFPVLDRMAGFQVDFTLQLESESHRKNNRSGFSLIFLSEDAIGIELAFWKNEIWAQSDSNTGGLFERGEGVAFQTTAGLTAYRLTILGDTYTLTANTQPILSGPLRDYSAFEGFPDPYQTPSFLFLGDNTTSAQARVRLGFVSVTGTESVEPGVTGTVTNLSTPLPAASLRPPPSITPVPTSTPAGKTPELCPSGSFVLVVMVIIPGMLKGFKARPKAKREIQ